MSLADMKMPKFQFPSFLRKLGSPDVLATQNPTVKKLAARMFQFEATGIPDSVFGPPGTSVYFGVSVLPIQFVGYIVNAVEVQYSTIVQVV
jgi:hypothetical protein